MVNGYHNWLDVHCAAICISYVHDRYWDTLISHELIALQEVRGLPRSNNISPPHLFPPLPVRQYLPLYNLFHLFNYNFSWTFPFFLLSIFPFISFPVSYFSHKWHRPITSNTPAVCRGTEYITCYLKVWSIWMICEQDTVTLRLAILLSRKLAHSATLHTYHNDIMRELRYCMCRKNKTTIKTKRIMNFLKMNQYYLPVERLYD
jgi:hypothetical protein